MRIGSIEDLHTISREYRIKLYYPESIKVNIGMASCGIASGAKASLEKAKNELSGRNGVKVNQTGCIGFCEEEPLVEIFGAGKPRVIYKKITEDKILDAIQEYRKAIVQKGIWSDVRSMRI